MEFRLFYFVVLLVSLIQLTFGQGTWKAIFELGSPNNVAIQLSGFSCVFYEPTQMLYVWGGISANSALNPYMFSYSFITTTWQSSSTTPSNNPPLRTDHSTVLYQNKMVIYSGAVPGSTPYLDVWIYNINAGTWTSGSMTGGPTKGSMHHIGVQYQGKMYIHGGADGNTADGIFTTLAIYDINGNSWTLGTAGPALTKHTAAVTTNGIIVVYGGVIDFNNTPNYKVYTYTISTSTWASPSTGTVLAIFSCSQMIRDTILIFGGIDQSLTNGENTFTAYNSTTQTWASINATGITPPNALLAGCALTSDNRFILLRGESASGTYNSMGDHYEWDPSGSYDAITTAVATTAEMSTQGVTTSQIVTSGSAVTGQITSSPMVTTGISSLTGTHVGEGGKLSSNLSLFGLLSFFLILAQF